MSRDEKANGIWLEVSAVRRQGNRVYVQLSGDKEDREPVWWPVSDTIAAADEADKKGQEVGTPEDPEKRKAANEAWDKADSKAATLSSNLFDAREKKRLVLARLEIAKNSANHPLDYLHCKEIRIQSADSGNR
jgi:hypothetical protein